MYTEEVNAYQRQLAACGVKAARVIAYAINVGTFEQQAVLECTRLHLVGVANEILRSRRVIAHRHKAPLLRRRKSRPAAPTQV